MITVWKHGEWTTSEAIRWYRSCSVWEATLRSNWDVHAIYIFCKWCVRTVKLIQVHVRIICLQSISSHREDHTHQVRSLRGSKAQRITRMMRKIQGQNRYKIKRIDCPEFGPLHLPTTVAALMTSFIVIQRVTYKRPSVQVGYQVHADRIQYLAHNIFRQGGRAPLWLCFRFSFHPIFTLIMIGKRSMWVNGRRRDLHVRSDL